MSCGNPVAGGEEALMERKSKFDKSTWCIKCKSVRGNIVIRHTVYCKDCFLPSVTTKFRRCIEPHINKSSQVSKRIAFKATGNLLLGFSGGLGSTVLLDLLSNTYFPSAASLSNTNGKGGKGHPRNKRVWTKAYICYVEICNAFPEGQMKDHSEDVQEFCKKSEHFELFLARIEDAFSSGWWNKVRNGSSAHTVIVDEDLQRLLENTPQTSNDPISSLRSYLTSLPTQTAVQSSIALLTRLILIYTAHYLRCSHLALGTSLTSLSISLISAVAQGGGFNIRDEYFEEWREPASPNGDDDQTGTMPVRVVRPLRDIGMKECAAWAYWRKLSILGRERLPGMTGKQTIGSLTRNFIVGLERDYPSTVSTIVRTCSKVEARDEANDRCLLCERAMPSGVLDWKTRISVRSQLELDSRPCSIASDDTKRSDQLRNSLAVLSPRLCFACHTHLTSKSSRSTSSRSPSSCLPQWVYEQLTRTTLPKPRIEDGETTSNTAMSREQMKSVVREFLL